MDVASNSSLVVVEPRELDEPVALGQEAVLRVRTFYQPLFDLSTSRESLTFSPRGQT